MRRPALTAVVPLVALGVFGLAVPVFADADPGFAATELQFIAALYQREHPETTRERLVELGNLACAIRRQGRAADAAQAAVADSLTAQHVNASSDASAGLVQEARRYLCPDVADPQRTW